MEDVPLLVNYMLRGRKNISNDAVVKLLAYNFPGNVRELENIVETAVYTASSDLIHPDEIVLPSETQNGWPMEEVIVGNFWESVARPYSERRITRNQVEHVIRRGLQQTRGNYRKLLPLFRIPDSDYKRFMDFLRRHHCNLDFRQFRKK
jgi:DNA-binding NtrC family response regulator